MGKGNRARLKRDEEVLARSKNNVKTKKANSKGVPLWVGNLILSGFAVLLVVVVAWSAITSSGILLKLSNYASTADFELSGTQMTYLFKTIYNDFVQQNSSYLTYFGLSTSKSLKSQTSMYKDDAGNVMTWFDVFAQQTEEQAKQLLVLCQMAKKEGYATISEDDKKTIDSAIASIKKEGAQYGYSLSEYLSAVYGPGVSEKDVRTVMEYQSIASNYYSNVLEDRLLDAITEDRINTHFEENKNKFMNVDYLKYTIKVTKATVKADADISEKDKAEKDYTDGKAKADEYAAKFEAAKTTDEFIAVLVDYIMAELAADEFDEEYAEEFKKIKEEEKHTDEQKEAFKAATFEKLKADLLKIDLFGEEEEEEEEKSEEEKKEETKTDLQKAEEKLYSDILSTFTTTVKGTYTKNSTYSEDSDFSKWLFDDTRKANDTKLDKTENDEKNSYTVDSSIVVKEKYKDETMTKNVGHILFTTSKHEDPEAKAKEVLALYEGGAKTREAFEALGKEHTEDSSVFYEDVYEGQMVEEFEDWLFDKERKEGDTGIVKTTYGYHIMYFDGDGEATWHLNVKNNIYNDDYAAWYEAAVTETNVTINSKNINKIDA